MPITSRWFMTLSRSVRLGEWGVLHSDGKKWQASAHFMLIDSSKPRKSGRHTGEINIELPGLYWMKKITYILEIVDKCVRLGKYCPFPFWPEECQSKKPVVVPVESKLCYLWHDTYLFVNHSSVASQSGRSSVDLVAATGRRFKCDWCR